MKKIVAMLVLIVVAIVIGFSVKIGPDPVKMARVTVGCPIVVNGVTEPCDLP